MNSKLEQEGESGQISREVVDWLLKKIFQLPKVWLVIISVFIVISTCEISKSNKEFSFKFRVTNTTAVFLALTWLPSVLKVFALSGGAIKTPAGEISGSSMMPMLQSLTSDSLGFLIEQTKVAEDFAPPQQQLEMRTLRQEWKKVYASRIPLHEARQQIECLAQRYKELRMIMPSGAQRTFEMESIVGRMRALAPHVSFSVKEVNDLMQSQDQGKRLLGLSIADWSADPTFFDAMIKIISDSQTAFEQYIGLRTMQKLVSKLEVEQQKVLHAVLTEQRDFNPEEKHWIRPDSNRWLLSDRLLLGINS